MTWPPPPDCSLAERTEAWTEERERLRKAWADAKYLPPPPELPRPEKTWPAGEYWDAWINKKVRIKRGFKNHPIVKKGAVGLVVDWDDGWPMIWFGKGNGSGTNPVGDWVCVPLDRLEKIE